MPQFGSWKNYVTLTMVDVSIHGSVESDGHADFFLHFQIYTQVRYTNMENRIIPVNTAPFTTLVNVAK